ncbi:MAG: hypothetical protein QOH05_4461 [Acetobacteraceae bacterium]|nr:hypothetical protein [Acetobacteraceae bacterium]
MTETSPAPPRVGWLEGLRGLAAMQVVLLHYVSAFFPAMISTYPLHEFWWQSILTAPLAFLYDGSAAVYLFFIMSGAALTQAFSPQPFALAAVVTRGLIRLGLPMAAATLLAAALYALWPDAHVVAAGQTDSLWLNDIGPREVAMASIIHQIVIEGLLTGFDGLSLFPPKVAHMMGLVEREHAFDTPRWTLHIEFVGSLLILLLVAVRAWASRAAYRATCAVLCFGFALSPLSLFVVGHLAASHLRPGDGRKKRVRLGMMGLGMACLTAGILLCTMPVIRPIWDLWSLLPPSLRRAGHQSTLQMTIGAVLVFGGLVLLPILQRQLQRPTMRRLGTISFSLYLIHFPILFTGVAACFTFLNSTLPYGAAVAAVSVGALPSASRWRRRSSAGSIDPRSS